MILNSQYQLNTCIIHIFYSEFNNKSTYLAHIGVDKFLNYGYISFNPMPRPSTESETSSFTNPSIPIIEHIRNRVRLLDAEGQMRLNYRLNMANDLGEEAASIVIAKPKVFLSDLQDDELRQIGNSFIRMGGSQASLVACYIAGRLNISLQELLF